MNCAGSRKALPGLSVYTVFKKVEGNVRINQLGEFLDYC